MTENDKSVKEENEKLRDQISVLKSDFEDKVMDLHLKVDEQESELRIKDEFIDEANRVIEEFNEEKHQVDAKFRHLLQIYDEGAEEIKFNQGDAVDLEECFETLERVLEGYR